MLQYQNSDLLGLIGRGTLGGRQRADGSDLEPGIHLRWQISPALGFPQGGFDVYRRDEANDNYWQCGAFREADVVGAAWLPYDPDSATVWAELTVQQQAEIVPGCTTAGQINAALFPGRQRIRLSFTNPVRAIRITFRPGTPGVPVVEAYADSSSGHALVARQRAHEDQVEVYADRIDHLVLIGEDMVICELCVISLAVTKDLFWPQIPLNGATPIYLPITHPTWGSPHPHSPDDQAETEARLPLGLSAERQQAYADGFRDELHPLLYDLVGCDPQRLFRLKNADLDTAATLDWPALSLLQLLALDPNLARILGLYWHDQPPSDDTYYDYRLIAHYGDAPYPGFSVDFAALSTGTRYGTTLMHEGLTVVSANPLEAATTTWAGNEQPSLHVIHEIPLAPVTVRLTQPVKSISLHVVSARPITARAFVGTRIAGTWVKLAGEHALLFEDSDGIDQVLLLPTGDVDLVSVTVRSHLGPIGDVTYDVFHLRSNTTETFSSPELEAPQVTPVPTGFDPTGQLLTATSRVDLRWPVSDPGGHYLRHEAEVFYQIQRSDLAADGQTVLGTAVLNEHAPALIASRTLSGAGRPYYADEAVPEGLYDYALRGIDVFGVLGDWGPAAHVEVRDRRAPPPPQAVQATYLDAADPWLSEADRAWATDHGNGVRLTWQWPGAFALQAPDLSAARAEFRVYAELGAFNRMDGMVRAVTAAGASSVLETDLNWPGAADALAGQSLRVNQNFFTITANSQGPDTTLTVTNLTAPELAPAVGPCSLTLSADHPNWRDVGLARNWDRRLHIEPYRDTPPVSTTVSAIDDFDPAVAGAEVVGPGATRTVTLDQGLSDPDGVLLPGVLVCAGRVYRTYGHGLGNSLRVHLAPIVAAADQANAVEPAVGEACTYYPGRRYEVLLAGLALPLAVDQALAIGHLAVACSDGQPDIADNPIWLRRGRGGLGDRPGNESALSRPARVQAIRRTLPAAVANVPEAPADPIYAEPADYYGRARYTLTWEAVPAVTGYAVYRCGGAALFDQDRRLRQTQQGAYAQGSVFADDPGFRDWLAGVDPALSEAELLANVDENLAVWRAWAERFYPGLSDLQVQALANLPGSERVFRKVTADWVTATTYTDTFDGRGQGLYVYRLRTADAAGNLSPWPEARAFPPVHVFNVTPPPAPLITSVAGGENAITVRWAAQPRAAVRGYRLYRTADQASAADWRLMDLITLAPEDAYTVVVSSSPAGGAYTFTDLTVRPGQTYRYALLALGSDGSGADLASRQSVARAGRAYDLTPPAPPVWDEALSGWVYVDDAGTVFDWGADLSAALNPVPAIRLIWANDPRQAAVLIARHDPLIGRQVTLGPWAPGLALSDTLIYQIDRQVDPSLTYSFSGKAESLAGLVSASETMVTIAPVVGP